MEKMLAWTFVSEVTSPTKEETQILLENEVVEARFKTVRDIAIITDKRIIVIDSQRITGKKKEIYVIPFKSINMYSTENSGTIDFNSEVELWTRAGHIKLNLKKGIDVHRFSKILAKHIL